ncbi:MAG: L-histidine N(alpha)-methyltransferase [Limisphaerales bacterium]
MALVAVRFHHSQFPDSVRHDLVESLRQRKLNHKFHYDSIKQSQKWLALHEQYSPARTDPDCIKIYDKSFQFAGEKIGNKPVHLIGLGCGGGQKEEQLLRRLVEKGTKVHFTASDVSSALVLVAQQRAVAVIGTDNCDTLVCDLQTGDDLPLEFGEATLSGYQRIITFFGLIPNFEPQQILPRLSAFLQPGDWLLLSANLSPGFDYHAGVEQVLPLYQNRMTEEWLMVILQDLGVEQGDGEMEFLIEDRQHLKRITALFHFRKSRELHVHGETIPFIAGDSIQLFFSYRHTPDTLRQVLGEVGIGVENEWITSSGEEGVFLCRKRD